MKVFTVDYSKCNGCYNCQIACKDEHVDNDWTPIACPQPETGHFWMKVSETTRGSVPRVRVTYIPFFCQHCDEAPCIEACADEAIIKRDDGLVLIEPEKCTGCQKCVAACSYGAIYFNDALNLAQKCTGCAHLIDDGWKEPRCVDACPTGALRFGEEEDFRDEIAGAEFLHPEHGTKPRVYHLNYPRKFIAGGVYEALREEIIEAATLTLTDLATGAVLTATSDEFGDFWFEDLPVSEYRLAIEAHGFVPATIHSIRTDCDVNLGDIPLQAKGGAR